MKSIVLSSGGIDSTTCLSMMIKKHGVQNVVAVSVLYGQRHVRELESAQKVTQFYGIEHHFLDLKTVYESVRSCALLARSDHEIQHSSYAEQDKSGRIISSYVPFRNGLMLSAIASYGMGNYPEEEIEICLGNHLSDSSYADCTPAFVEAFQKAVSLGTYGKVSFVAPLIGMTKKDVVKTGLSLGTPYQFTWSCYEGGEKPCGKCASCIDRAKAFAENHAKDPAGEA